MGHFGDESFQSVVCTGTDNLYNENNQETKHIQAQTNATHKVTLMNSK